MELNRRSAAEIEAGAEQEGTEKEAAKAADSGQVSLKVADVQATWSTPVQDPHKQPHATHAPQCRAT